MVINPTYVISEGNSVPLSFNHVLKQHKVIDLDIPWHALVGAYLLFVLVKWLEARLEESLVHTVQLCQVLKCTCSITPYSWLH